MAGRPPARYTVVFDGHCRVCRKSVELLGKMDREQVLELVAFQAPGVPERFPWIPLEAYDESIQVIAADGTTWAGARAVEELTRIVPPARWVSWMFRVPLVRPLAEAGYRVFARNRYRFGCEEHCRVREHAS